MSHAHVSNTNSAADASDASEGEEAFVRPVTRKEAASVNIRSCFSCRKRKVRCGKLQPCSNCVKAGVECIFPTVRRESRNSTTKHNAELAARLKYLECIIERLERRINSELDGRKAAPETCVDNAKQHEVHKEISLRDNDNCVSSEATVGVELGRLIVNEGRSQYLSQSFWAVASGNVIEIADVHNPSLLREDSEALSPDDQPVGDCSTDGYELIFDSSAAAVDLGWLRPQRSQSLVLLLIYEDNCDPVLKITHRLTVRDIFFKAASSNDGLSKSEKALSLSIQYGAVCSLSTKRCQDQFGIERSKLALQFRRATEQALRSAQFLQSPCLKTLQAFVIYLWILRSQDDIRLVWSLSGLAIHLARSLGMHRDGANIHLSPFETEMRRRLWWHLCLLDSRSAEDQGIEPSFSEGFYDAHLPLNINDEDISVNTKDVPRERVGTTEMTFCLIRFELSKEKRKITLQNHGSKLGDCSGPSKSFAETKSYIDKIHHRMETKYLDHCDTTIPIDWASNTVGRMVLAKLLLIACHPFQYFNGDSQGLSTLEARDLLFDTAVDLLELSITLQLNESIQKWKWLFNTYTQWHAMAFLLLELCEKPQRVGHERAWKSVDFYYEKRILHGSSSQKGLLWHPLQKLMKRAQASRGGPRQGSDPGSRPPPQRHFTLEQDIEVDESDLGVQKPANSDRMSSGLSIVTGQGDLDFQIGAEFNIPGWAPGYFSIEDVTMSAEDFDLMLPATGVTVWDNQS